MAKAKAKTKSRAAKTKSAATKKTVAKSSARRARPVRKASAVRHAKKAATKAAKKPEMAQTVAISHYNNSDFESGLRSYAQYRDLGMVEATRGMVRAHVLRFTEPCDPKVVSKLHFHDTQFQMVYVLNGWVKTKLGDNEEVTMRRGSSWTQPPKIKHVINDYSDDCELLEIILPAEFDTVEV